MPKKSKFDQVKLTIVREHGVNTNHFTINGYDLQILISLNNGFESINNRVISPENQVLFNSPCLLHSVKEILKLTKGSDLSEIELIHSKNRIVVDALIYPSVDLDESGFNRIEINGHVIQMVAVDDDDDEIYHCVLNNADGSVCYETKCFFDAVEYLLIQ